MESSGTAEERLSQAMLAQTKDDVGWKEIIELHILAYLEAGAEMAKLKEMQNISKTELQGLLDQNNLSGMECLSGSVSTVQSAGRTSYDTGGLDELSLENPAMAKILGEYRKKGKPSQSLRVARPRHG